MLRDVHARGGCAARRNLVLGRGSSPGRSCRGWPLVRSPPLCLVKNLVGWYISPMYDLQGSQIDVNSNMISTTYCISLFREFCSARRVEQLNEKRGIVANHVWLVDI